MTNYQTIRYAVVDLYEMLKQLKDGKEPDMEKLFSAIRLLFGRKKAKNWMRKNDYEGIRQALDENMPIFQDAETTGYGFLQRMFQLYGSGKLVDENGKDLIEIYENMEKEDIEGYMQSITDIAQAMGISPTVVVIALHFGNETIKGANA